MLLILFKVDLSSWEQKIQRDAVAERVDGERPDEGAESVLMEHQSDSAMEMSIPSQELYKDGVLTLGCIGIHLFTENMNPVTRLKTTVDQQVISLADEKCVHIK